MPSSPGSVGLARALPISKPRLWSLPARLGPVTVHPTRWGVGPQPCCTNYCTRRRDRRLSAACMHCCCRTATSNICSACNVLWRVGIVLLLPLLRCCACFGDCCCCLLSCRMMSYVRSGRYTNVPVQVVVVINVAAGAGRTSASR